jgi:hypothetical protein
VILSTEVAKLLVSQYGWDEGEAKKAVDSARACVDGVRWKDLPGLLAALLNAQREVAKNAE